MMELLVSKGADVNGVSKDRYPVIHSPCETVDYEAMRWLLEHGADPNCRQVDSRVRITALDYLLGSYVRTAHLPSCIDLLAAAGGQTRHDHPAVLALLRYRRDLLAQEIAIDPALVHTQFPDLDIGTSGERMLTLRGATLLRVPSDGCNGATAGGSWRERQRTGVHGQQWRRRAHAAVPRVDPRRHDRRVAGADTIPARPRRGCKCARTGSGPLRAAGRAARLHAAWLSDPVFRRNRQQYRPPPSPARSPRIGVRAQRGRLATDATDQLIGLFESHDVVALVR